MGSNVEDILELEGSVNIINSGAETCKKVIKQLLLVDV